MTERTVPKADARLIAEAVDDCAVKAMQWKDRAIAAEAHVRRFVEWVARADDPKDDAQYLNGEHPDQRTSGRDGWDDVREIATAAYASLPSSAKGTLHE